MTTIIWPRIVDVDSKTLSQIALELALWCYATRVRESGGHNRGTHPDEYNRAVGLDPKGGWPWCTSAWYTLYAEAARQKRVVNPFPKTAKAVEVWNRVDPVCRDSNPGIGAHYVLDHGRDWATQLAAGQRLTDNGHFGACVTLDGPNCKTEISANTNRDGAREGDSWWVHTVPDGGDPSSVHGGRLIGWIYLDRANAPSLVA